MNVNYVVVDTSVAIKWAIKEEDSHKALGLLSEWIDRETMILAPALLSYEAANVFHQHVRKGLLPFEEAKQALSKIIFDIITFDFTDAPDLCIRAMLLAQQFRLPAAYDAQYLALAESKACELWTADLRMWNSLRGKLSWVHWMPDYSPS